MALAYRCRTALADLRYRPATDFLFLAETRQQRSCFAGGILQLVAIGVEAATTLYLVAALFPLGNAGYLKAFAPEQLYAMASLSLKLHSYGFGMSLIFFGCFCLVIGYLIFRSGYLPKTLGVLMQIAGLSYLTNSFALVLVPALANRWFPAILLPAFVGETSLCLWLLVKGVNVPKWQEQVSVWRCSGG